jgi:hypothetical protein
MQEILPWLKAHIHTKEKVSFLVLNPDLSEGYAGHSVILNKQRYLYRGYKAWVDLAELLKCKILSPSIEEYPLVKLTFVKLKIDSFHKDKSFVRHGKEDEKYGMTSQFSAIHKMEEPAFYYYYLQALENIHISKRKRVLNLGVNRGDEFEVIQKHLEKEIYQKIAFVGIDHSKSAIKFAQDKYKKHTNMKFYAHDINELEHLQIGKFDTLISIGTLQSPSIAFKTFFMQLVQEYLEEDSAIILGFPNSRWVGGELLYGAKAPNYAMSEMSLVFNDIIFCKKYLQQKRYRVTITGKQYLFLTATKIVKK